MLFITLQNIFPTVKNLKCTKIFKNKWNFILNLIRLSCDNADNTYQQ